jgi:hypothetical protein
MQESVCEIVRKMEQDYTNGNTTISKYVDFDMYETLNKIDAYVNSVHTSGSQDSLGRDKPFFNIVTAARNIWYRATDIDRKNIRLKAEQIRQYALAFAAQMRLKVWMKKSAFGVFLNEWGRTLATYGSAVRKFIEKNGYLHPSVIPWNRIICDPIDFDNNPKIEVLEFTPAQLRKEKGYDQEVVKQLLQDLSPREDLNKQKKDNKSNYIKVYEVHGELPLSLITDKEDDEETYAQQMHVVSFVAKSGRGRKTEYEDYTLYKGKEKKDPYGKDDLITEDGRTLAIGAVEHLFEAQWMVNHSQKQIKDTLDFSSLLILQSSDGTLVGRNVLNSLITGDILIHQENQPLTQLNNKADITQIQSYSAQWQNVGREINGISEAMSGQNPPSGSAWRQTEALLQESHSLFELMRENKGLAIEEMFREYVIPYLKTQLDTSKEISDILDSHGVTQFDAMYVPNEAIRRNNKRIIETVLSGEIADQGELATVEQDVKKELSVYGNQRSLVPSDIPDKTWKEQLEGFEWTVEVDPTQEDEDINEALTSLTTTFKTIASLAGRPMTSDERLVFNQIMEKAGTISPIQLSQSQSGQPQLQQQQALAGGSTAVNSQVTQSAFAGVTQ